MAEKYLVFRLYAPMASWGQAAVGETRPTATYPGRGAILGLLAAALGIKRHDDAALQQLADGVKMGVKERSSGALLRDYHTTQVLPNRRGRQFRTRRDELAGSNRELNTILSSRDYRCDGLWTVAVWLTSKASPSLETIAAALQQPHFHLYLGRKSCPLAAPLSPVCIDAETLRQALDYEFEALTPGESRALGLGNDVSYYWEGEQEMLDGAPGGVESSEVWDEPLNRRRWQFGKRTEFRRRIREGAAS